MEEAVRYIEAVMMSENSGEQRITIIKKFGRIKISHSVTFDYSY